MRPWIFPVAMTGFNVLSFAVGVLGEGRIKFGAAQFTVLYGLTVLPALRGDIVPFCTVAAMPG